MKSFDLNSMNNPCPTYQAKFGALFYKIKKLAPCFLFPIKD